MTYELSRCYYAVYADATTNGSRRVSPEGDAPLSAIFHLSTKHAFRDRCCPAPSPGAFTLAHDAPTSHTRSVTYGEHVPQ